MINKIQCFSAININDQERKESTSGGIFSLLCKFILDKNGVVYGAAYDTNQNVFHCKVTSEEEIHKIRGAKYAPSSLNGIYFEIEQLLNNNVWVLFSGTPCQVVSLKKYLKKDYDILVTVDLVCHGVPVQEAWRKYLEYRKDQDGQDKIASNINMRSKVTGWSRYGYSVSFKYCSGYEYTCLGSADTYMYAFVNNMILRPVCNKCQFKGTNRQSDFTLGDFWGVWDIRPSMDDNKGTSLVLVHSNKGMLIWKNLANDIICEKITYEQACEQNLSIIRSSACYENRDELLRRIDKEGWGAVIDEIQIHKKKTNTVIQSPSFVNRMNNKLKRLLESFNRN